MTSSQLFSNPASAAALFDSSGEIHWVVRGRGCFTGIQIKNIDRAVAKALQVHYRGHVRYTSPKYAMFQVFGKDSDVFAYLIYPQVVVKKQLIELYIHARQNIDHVGRGQKSTLSEDDMRLRKEIAIEFKRLQSKEK